MPSTPRPKVGRKARAQAALRHQLTAEELFADLTEAYVKAKGRDKQELGLQLAPYLKPKLKSVDVTQTAHVKVTVKIGGDDAND